MTEPFLAEIRLFGFNFAPRGWALCNGQLIAISQNTALFSLLGTQYGGDGRTTFALPNLLGSVPMGVGGGPGLTPRQQGETGGEQNVTLINSELPVHRHDLMANSAPGDLPTPGPAFSLARSAPFIYKTPGGAANAQPLSPSAVGVTGGSQPHNNLQPYLTVNFCIALQGIFPRRP
jgi:microcystin-dependent protein